jgi:phosphoadenosine phosphosulfate reductase
MSMHQGPGVDELSAELRSLSLPDRIARIRDRVPGRIVFTTSFGLEDQAVIHAIATSGAAVAIATLDTGRLFPETYDLWAETERRFGLRIEGYAPDHRAVQALVSDQGINGFRQSVEARKACCAVRKVEPLGRALAGAAAWITGLRADQSADRSGTPLATFDPGYGLIKANPLVDWSRPDLVAYVAEHGIPSNPLHERGFVSIGCAPCTRAIAPGEPERAGRWWWEEEAKKECGLHLRPTPGGPARLRPETEVRS